MANPQKVQAVRLDDQPFAPPREAALRPVFQPSSRPARRAFLLSLLVHGAAIGALLTQGLFPPPPRPAVPLEVSWISPIAEAAASLPPPAQPSPEPPPRRAPAKLKQKTSRAPQPISIAKNSSRPDETVAMPVEAVPTEATSTNATPSAAPAREPQAAPASTASAPVTPARFAAAYLRNPAPAYPAVSRRRGEQGRILLRVHVLPTGLPDEILIQQGSSFERLDQAAIDAVQRWKFVPAQQGGSPIASWVIVPIQFSLQDFG